MSITARRGRYNGIDMRQTPALSLLECALTQKGEGGTLAFIRQLRFRALEPHCFNPASFQRRCADGFLCGSNRIYPESLRPRSQHAQS